VLERLRAEYENYLHRQRGLAESTIYHCTRSLARFLEFRFGDKLGDLNAITPDDIVAFICQLKAGSHPRRQKALPSDLRNLFSSCSGYVAGNEPQLLHHCQQVLAMPSKRQAY
jgi:integrase/recombinase XerD